MDPAEAEATDKRLDDIRRVKRRYGEISELDKYVAKAEEELDRLENAETLIAGLKEEAEKALSAAKRYAAELHDERVAAAEDLASSITENLRDLGMKSAEFSVSIDFRDPYSDDAALGDDGVDRVRFLISPNLGEPLKPLAKIASGGEASRFMLGLKRITADLEGTDVLVFDEIDTGISGRIAMVVAEKLADIALSHQVIAVTHLPQLAAMADAHFLIEKSETEGRTVTHLKRLNEKESLNELARLQGSVGPAELSYENALELKKWAESYKSNRK